ncbi:DUF1801 domain-containing protein [Thiobacillus thioparus]|uniref:DUF1801 domain-containing protein n=1 Tax=Thiobacillus thioparus TaxID=931 RepID=UPI00035DE674|nr:DUF1801 domain-containing protein [Thiobacillus thioparus]
MLGAKTQIKRFPKKTPTSDADKSPSELIDARIQGLQDWRGVLLAQLRELIREASSEITEEWKWNTPVWSCNGIICTGETYKKAVKLTFPKGASLADPSGLFNASLEGKARRAIDFAEGASINEAALMALVQAAVVLNNALDVSRRKSAA